MKPTRQVCAVGRQLMLAGAMTLTLPAMAQQCQNLVWSDEFNGTAVDPLKWEFQLGDGCDIGLCGWGNNELQWYRAENATVADGLLTLTARRERVRGKEYTSARLRTANMPAGGQWTHGRFEARIKLPNGTGMWPAFWMLPTDPDQGWPMSGEIDILEATGQADMIAFGTIHYGNPWPDNEWTSGRILKQPDSWSDDFHTYAVEWEPNQIRWYLDDLLYSVKTPDDLSDPAFWTFENYQYHFLLNMAVGGNIGGWVDDSQLPQTMQVDYVRVYDNGQPSLAGDHLVEPHSTATYTVLDEGSTGSTYDWSLPAGATITAGAGTSSISVAWGTTGGDVAVAVNNGCGARNLAVNVHVLPEQSRERELDDFESNRNLNYTSVTGDFLQGAANPAPDTVNSSATVARYTRDATAQWDVIAAATTAIPDAAPYISGDKAFHLDVYTAAPVGTEILIQLENSSIATPDNYPSGRHSKYIALTTARNQWQRLKFSLEDRIDGATADSDVNSLVILIDPDAFTGDTYFLDNLDLYGAGDGNSGGEATSIHVQDITTGTLAAGKGQKRGTATVTVYDDLGNPVADVAVAGTFSGSFAEAASGVTDASGQVTVETQASAGGSVSVGFCVDSLSHAALSYDAQANLETCQ